MKKIGLCDTTFATVNMGKLAKKRIQGLGYDIEIVRKTVPGIKDLPVCAKKLIEDNQCDIVVAMGMPGDQQIDKMCADQASNGIINAQLMTNTHIIEVFIHMDEAKTKRELYEVVKNRVEKHIDNAINLIFNENKLIENAGCGLRQGYEDVGPIK